MKPMRAPDVRTTFVVVLVGALAAMATFWGLAALTQPSGLHGRLEKVDAAVARIETARHLGENSDTYRPQALCEGAAEAAAAALETRLKTSAAAASITAANISVTPSDPMQPSVGLRPVVFEIDGSGQYDAFLLFLKLLDQEGPEVFADTLDVRAHISFVSFKFTGRVLCSTSAA
jgi:hypothetical protein